MTYRSGVVCSHNDCLCETVRCRDGAARGVRREMVASWTRTVDAGCSSGEGSVGFSCLSVASLSVALESESASAVSIRSRDERVSWKAMRGPILASPDWGGGRDEARGSNLKSKIRHWKGTAYRGRWTGVCWSSFTQRWLMFGEWAGVWPGLGAKLSCGSGKETLDVGCWNSVGISTGSWVVETRIAAARARREWPDHGEGRRGRV